MERTKRTKAMFIHILPVLLGVAFTAFLSMMVYYQMLDNEEKNSWNQLDVVANTVSEKITIRFEDNINLMERVADAVTLKGSDEEYREVLEYLQSVQKSTIFKRIDVLLPDNTLLHPDGVIHPIRERDLPYDTIITRGSHYSGRDTDKETGRQVIYCAVPIYTEGQAEGILIGVVDCLELSDFIKTYSFEGTSQIFLIDQQTGDYLMDNWQSSLGNLKDTARRERLPGFEDVDYKQDMLNGVPGHIAFVSQENGKASYTSYMPVEGFPWSVAVMVQEDQVLKNVNELSRILQKIAMMELVLLVSYVAWNLFVSYTLVKQQENVQKMALEAQTTKAKHIFLASVSHDIRTPLNAIHGYTHILEQCPEDPELVQDMVGKIKKAGTTLMQLLDDVLELTRIDSGKDSLDLMDVDLHVCLENLYHMFDQEMDEAGIDFHMHKDIRQANVRCDELKWTRVLMNMLSNARKFTPDQGIVTLSAEQLTAVQNGRATYRFSVRDTGIGMSEEFQKRAFQEFEREKTSTASGVSGNGLGLAIIKRMVGIMGGTCELESELGRGTEISFTVELEVGQSRKAPVEECACKQVDFTGSRVLLVEDNEFNREIARFILENMGLVVEEAEDGAVALDKLLHSGSCFDLVLMDLQMPVMDGYTAAQEIRQLKDPNLASIPILAMTANAFQEDRDKCLEAGMDGHIGKPIDPETLANTLRPYFE